ncbi:tryptophan-rich sensory protein [Skermanella mucosa]|uniref:TspO/MBR family protein n=1 Tax=Skermanella mucosa TaxID=1789672 RepID=UPI00192C9942|nr:TspO/MBR family protein [Skermanella mucosa]UEM19735.1 tryptophan-rich sensory protein [Skermanella mucosa]
MSTRPTLSPGMAALAVGGALALSGLFSRRYSPDPTHPEIRDWYDSLEKPAYKPPDPVFGAAWPVLSTLLGVGAYRLMRSAPSPERDAALALWAFDIAVMSGWTKVFFGERSLTAAAVDSAVLVAGAAAYVERASRVDGVAAALGVPFAAWSVFGGVMTEDLRERNRDLDGRGTGRRPPGRRTPARSAQAQR